MASIARRCPFYSLRCPPRISPRTISIAQPARQWHRPLHTTPVRQEERPGDKDVHNLTDEQWKLEHLARDIEALDPKFTARAPMMFLDDYEVQNTKIKPGPSAAELARGFWAEGEEDGGPDDDYYGDDLNTMGHGELEQHRELREYARLAAWDLPLLSRMCFQTQNHNQSY